MSRNIVSRSVLVVSVTAATLLGLVGCTDSTQGTATPSTSDITSTTSSSGTSSKPGKPTTSTSDSPDSALADVRPCSLLTASSASAMKVSGKGSEDRLGKGRLCQWIIPAESVRDQATLSIAIFDTLGLKDIVAKGEVKSIPKIGSHEARQFTGVAESCVFSLEVGPSTRVDVSGTAISFDKGCEVATAAVKLVEPELP